MYEMSLKYKVNYLKKKKLVLCKIFFWFFNQVEFCLSLIKYLIFYRKKKLSRYILYFVYNF